MVVHDHTFVGTPGDDALAGPWMPVKPFGVPSMI